MFALSLIVVFSFFIMHFIEMAAFGSRVAGRVANRVALGTTLQLSIVTISRFFLIPLLPALGYLVESGILIEDYLIIVSSAYILTFLISIVILLKLNTFQFFFQKVFKVYNSRTIPMAVLVTAFGYNQNSRISSCKEFSWDRIVLKKTLLACFAYLFLISGFFVAFLLAILYPDNRLTLSQFTALFHGIGAILVAVYIDPMLSRSIDIYDDHATWINNTYSIIFGRVLSYLLILLAMFIFLVVR